MSTELSKVLAEFESKTSVYTRFGTYMEDLLTELLNLKNLKVHSVTHRVKESSSLKKKILDHPEKNYTSLDEITDLVGVRVITYFPDTVDGVNKLIREEFEVDDANSVDKRRPGKASEFGYASLHLIVSLSKARLAQTENKRFQGLKCEVQVRTVLQHAWAEIEHDLGYKSKIVVPDVIERNFGQLAALLENADSQFLELRNKLANYEAEARKDSQIESGQSTLKLDAATVILFVEKSKLFREIEDAIRPCWSEAKDVRLSPQYLQGHTAFLLQLGVKSLDNLNEQLHRHFDRIVAFSQERSKYIKEKVYPTGWSLMQLAQVIAACLSDRNKGDEWVGRIVRSQYPAHDSDIHDRCNKLQSILANTPERK